MRTLLVTGGAGFIGGTFVRRLLGTGHIRIINLDLLTYAGHLGSFGPLLKHDNHVFVHGDIGDRTLVSELLVDYRPDAVLNFAAESHVDRSIDGPSAFVTANVVGAVQLLNAVLDYWRGLEPSAAERFRFLQISTDEVYGSLGNEGAFRETSSYAPNSPYSASKAAADHFVRAFHHTYGLPTLTTNCSNNYGPYQFPEKLIPLITLNAYEGKALPVYGDGGNVRDWLHVDDHCAAIECVLARGRIGEVYNIGGGCERSNLEVVHRICDAVDELSPLDAGKSRRSLVHFVQDRPGHDRRYAIDFGKIQSELAWSPTIDFEAGLGQTVAWYLEHSAWVESITSGNYRRERLGLGLQ